MLRSRRSSQELLMQPQRAENPRDVINEIFGRKHDFIRDRLEGAMTEAFSDLPDIEDSDVLKIGIQKGLILDLTFTIFNKISPDKRTDFFELLKDYMEHVIAETYLQD